MADDDFEAWIGQIGKEPSLRSQLHRAVSKAGGFSRSSQRSSNGSSGGRARRFTGARIGRGAAVSALLSLRVQNRNARARRVIVKARYVKLAGKGLKAATAHLRYLQRDGTTREGERGALYGPNVDVADGKDFLEQSAGDRHQFRFIVSPEDGVRYDDFKTFTRRLMSQVEADLETRLDWVAVDHYNTGHPHTHIVVRGVNDRGKNLVIAPGYIREGFAERAMELVNRDLGPRLDHEIEAANQREIAQERLTGIDRRMLADLDANGLASAWHSDPVEQSLRAGRLHTLARMDLASEEGKGRYRLAPNIEQTLREMGKRGDIIAAMHQQLKARGQLAVRDYAIFDPSEGRSIVGRVLHRGFSDEHEDRHCLIVEATDGRTHHVDIGIDADADIGRGRIVRIAPVATGVRIVDRTIVEIAAASGGRYDASLHRAFDPTASHDYADTHVRRLEAIRRSGGSLQRSDSGTWTIGPDYLEKAQEHERRLATQRPVQIEMLSDRPVEQLVAYEGKTWLDEQCLAKEPKKLHGHYGGEINKALRLRQQWLVEQGLAAQDAGAIRYRPDLLATLRQRELTRIGGQLSQELRLGFVPHASGTVEGKYRQAVQVGRDRYALIEKSKEFTLVPWRPVLEKQLGKQVSGVMRGTTISWTFGRDRGGPDIGSFGM